MGLISAAIGTAASSANGAVVEDAAFLKAYPTLFAFVTQTQEDGKDRTPSSLLVLTQDGQFKLCLNEKDANLQLWRSAATFQDALKSLEKALASGAADWRKGWTPPARRKARK